MVKLVLSDFPEGNGGSGVCGIAHIAFLKHLFIYSFGISSSFPNANAVLSYYLIRTLFSSSNKGISTNLMKPIWAVGLLTLSRSIKGATGRPSDFSRSLYNYSAIRSLSKDVFERRTSTGSEVFFSFICLDSNKFVLLSFFSLIKTICPRV